MGEVLHRIMGRAVMRTFRRSIFESSGDLQFCAGQRGGCEAAVDAMGTIAISDDDECDAVLLVDADNAFNRINRKVMLHNICIVCPVIASYVINSYNQHARLFVTGGVEIHSQEGTTQGDPTAMPLYALGTIPLLNAISTDDTKHAAYADDLSTSGRLKSVLRWWQGLVKSGPIIGYFAKVSKSWLITKPNKFELAQRMFKDTGINVTAEGISTSRCSDW